MSTHIDPVAELKSLYTLDPEKFERLYLSWWADKRTSGNDAVFAGLGSLSTADQILEAAIIQWKWSRHVIGKQYESIESTQ